MWQCVARNLYLATLLLLCCTSVYAQQDTSKPQDQEPQERKNDASWQATGQQQNERPAVSPTPAYPVDAQIHAAGKATLWLGQTPLHYGPFGIASVDAFTVYDQFYPSAGGPSNIERLLVLRTVLSFDKAFKKSRLLVTYTPELFVLNGQERGTAVGNNVASIGTTYQLSPRLSLTVKDDFSQFRSRKVFPNNALETDATTGGIVAQYLLENSGTYTQNRVQAVFSYKLAPRWFLSVSPGYTYARTDTPGDPYVVHDSPNEIGLTYALSPRRNIGFLQTIEILAPTQPISTRGLFSTSGLFYSEQLSPTWWITARVAAEQATYPGFPTASWAVDGSFTMLKTFGLSELAINYYRGSTLTSFVNDAQTDRADISYGLVINKSLKWTNSVGYFRTVGDNPRIIGKYGISNLEYRLGAGFSIFTGYRREIQRGPIQQLLSGDRNSFISGIRWQPAPAAGAGH